MNDTRISNIFKFGYTFIQTKLVLKSKIIKLKYIKNRNILNIKWTKNPIVIHSIITLFHKI